MYGIFDRIWNEAINNFGENLMEQKQPVIPAKNLTEKLTSGLQELYLTGTLE